VDRRGVDGDLDAIAPEGTDSLGTDALAARPRSPRGDVSRPLPTWMLVLAGIGVLALVVSGVAAVHVPIESHRVRRTHVGPG
jgi:hypothetical protein